MQKRIIIIGAGPTGLGAAYRLRELGYKDWAIFEKDSCVGGLSASVKDRKGFTWDKGGHVLFSHYKYFEDVVEKLLGHDYIAHERRAFIYLLKRWVPYPFQNNIRYLPDKAMLECVLGLIEAHCKKNKSSNFKEWILHTFGKGIGKYFMVPHNSKTWAYRLELMSKDWIADRISVIDLTRIIDNIIHDRDDVSWGPNNKFKFPLYGGTGGLFNAVEPLIKDRLQLNKEMTAVNTAKRELHFKDGTKETYEILINTAPLDEFIAFLKPEEKGLIYSVSLLKKSGSLVVGLGIKGECRSDKCWMYFPEKKTPFYRVTYFSNYSPNNVPDHRSCWSLLCETAYSEYKIVNKKNIVEDTLSGLLETGLISKNEMKKIVSCQVIDLKHAYPVPTLTRDKTLARIKAALEKQNIYSRGRFGIWRYEIGNMDHSFMQGVELADRLLLGKDETICAFK